MLKTLLYTNIKNRIQQLQVENQRLRLEVKTYKLISEEYSKFKTIIARAAHDLRSPLTIILMVLPQCNILPEKLHNILKQSAIRVNDITKDILNPFAAKLNGTNDCDGQPVLISTEILSIVSAKEYEYINQAVKFVVDIKPNSKCAWVYLEVSAFNRALSNLINNAVNALDGKSGIITIILEVKNKKVNISVTDNGKGMPEIVIYKIMNGLSVTKNKSNGHGIGLGQVRDMLKNAKGKMSIESSIGVGTTMKLSFPRSIPPIGLGEKVELHSSEGDNYTG